MQKSEHVPSEENREEPTLEKLDRALEEEEEHLKEFPNHGIHLGTMELLHISKHSPELSKFFADAEEILELDTTTAARLRDLEEKYLACVITGKEIKELEERFLHPYYQKLQREKSGGV
ncbi:MAG: hypothetical protein HYW89_01235 [Candidatus Sungiibacteriota bacterium]|uniref:Uncharacterized protein n=1 Tax=Candidatus Sungiibacteriota bacterium TaxID=2750080 RepID=A0A7T5RK24_9BACT|nr:MAG: hypothetical protein HYW89_01235 [Candidatus Sungbacteria bacterium]